MNNNNINNDILVEIPDDELSELAEMYLNHQKDLPHVHAAIINGINWKKESGKQLIKFYSPNGNWRKNGTFFCHMQFNCNDVFISTLNEADSGIYEGLKLSNRFQYKRLLFFAIHYKTISVIKNLIKDMELEVAFDYPCPMFTMSIPEALSLNTDCPDEVYIQKLSPSDAVIINSLWPHKYPGSNLFLAKLIELNKAYGVFLKKHNKLVAWILQNGIGQMGMLQTVDECKRKGYGSLILKYMAKELAKDGIQPFGTVLENNFASKAMFEKLNFHNLGMSTYIGINFH